MDLAVILRICHAYENIMPSPLPFEQLGPYELIKTLGKGGMGSVFLGRHTKTGLEVAVKLIAENVADEPKFRRRFDAEVKSLQHLRHPNIIRLIGFGEEQGRLFYSMEVAQGESLHTIIRQEKRIGWERTIDIAIQVCAALKHAHDIGVIHRDLKPANLVVGERDQIKLVDFGIAKIFGQSNEQTMAGSVLGTADYMAPEQASGFGVTQRTDLYALGSLMYAMLSGKPPFRGKNVTEVIESVKRDKPVPLDLLNPELPDALIHLVHDLLEKNPEDRPPTALAVSNRLKAMRAGLERGKTLVIDEEPTSHRAVPGLGSQNFSSEEDAKRTQVSNTAGQASGSSSPSSSHSSAAIDPDATLVSVNSQSTRQRDEVGTLVKSETLLRESHYQSADALSEPSGWLPLNEETSASKWQTLLNVVALVGVLAAILAMAMFAFRSPSSDELFERAQNGDRSAIDSFIKSYPEDPRTSGLLQRQRSKRLLGVLKRLQTQSRLGLTQLTSAQEGFLTAMKDRQTQPAAALARVEGWLAVFEETSAQSQDIADLIELARFESERLKNDNRVTSLDPKAIELISKINDSVQKDDEVALRKMLGGVIDNFSDKSWAAPAVDEARLQLEVLDEFAK
jgi:serine/threonine protein kinase